MNKAVTVLPCHLVTFEDGSHYYRFTSDLWYSSGFDTHVTGDEALEIEAAYQAILREKVVAPCLTLPIL